MDMLLALKLGFKNISCDPNNFRVYLVEPSINWYEFYESNIHKAVVKIIILVLPK